MPDKEPPFGANIEFTKLPEERAQRLRLMAENYRVVREEFEAHPEAFEASQPRIEVTAHFKEALSVPLPQQIAAMEAALSEMERVKKLYRMSITDQDLRFFAVLKNLLTELLTMPPEELKTSPVLAATIGNLAEQAQKDRLAHIRRQGEKFAAQWKQKGRKDEKH